MPRGRPKKNKDLELATLIQENTDISNQEVEILPVEEVEIMSLSQLQKEKQELAAKRNQIMLKLDGRRLEQAIKIADAMDIAIEKMISHVTIGEDGEFVEMSAMDYKFYTESLKNLSATLQNVTRLDSVDSGGRAGRLSLKIEYETW